MKYLIFILLFCTLSCGNDLGCDERGLTYTNEEKCSDPDALDCIDDNIAICLDNYWIEFTDCSNLDAGTCDIVDGGPTCI